MSTNFALGSGAATAVAGAATLNNRFGKVTSEALTTAAAASYTLTLTNSQVKAGDIVVASASYGTATTGEPVVTRVAVTDGQIVFTVKNVSAATAVNGTIVVNYMAYGA